MDEKILDRIQKLLALATSDNVNEAAAAASKAQELMTRHQLELADLQAITPGATGESIDNDELFREKSLIMWKTTLAAGIAKANGCAVYTSQVQYLSGKNVANVCRIVGIGSSVSTVRYMYTYLMREIDRLAALNREGHDRAWLNSFRLGAVATITYRLQTAANDAKKGASTGALVVVDKNKDRLEEALAALGLRTGPEHKIKDTTGFSAGAKAAKDINLTAGPGLSAGAKGDLKA
jgi:hypothetical protein